MKKTIALLLFSAYVSSEVLIHTSNYIDGINDRVLKKHLLLLEMMAGLNQYHQVIKIQMAMIMLT